MMKTTHYALVFGGLLLACGCTAVRETATPKEPARSVTPARARAPGAGIPLFGVARAGQVEVAKRLLAEGANVNVRNEKGGSPLHAAACKGQSEMIELLIANGAEVNARANNGQTPLHKAANGGDRKDNKPGPGHLAAAKVLLKHGADPLAKDNNGKSPSDLAGTKAMKALLGRDR
jgi:ankyrin repeat protein